VIVSPGPNIGRNVSLCPTAIDTLDYYLQFLFNLPFIPVAQATGEFRSPKTECLGILLLHYNRLRPFVWDYLGEPVPEETFNHSYIVIIIQPLSASSIYYDP